MINIHRKTIFTAFTIIFSALVILSVVFGFKGFGRNSRIITDPFDTAYSIQSFRIPENVTFAGERMPLENFDTRESLEREILTSAYRHSSTIMIIKRANRYLPVIEKILEENHIPDDFKYLVAAESEYSNMISPVGATGFWQIMPETGKEEGMEINTVIDERYSVEKSTQFACDYFRRQSWY